MISKGQIDQCDYVAGRHWQAAWENAEIGSMRAIDPTREAVDGGSLPEMLTDTQRRAVQDLKAAREALGKEGHQLICDVLGRGMSITQAARNRGLQSETDRKYAGKRFRECLSTLAIHFGYANREARSRPKVALVIPKPTGPRRGLSCGRSPHLLPRPARGER
jgi:hypothetical protein